MKPSTELFERLKNDDRYKKMIEAAPEESREHIIKIVSEFMNELGSGLDELKEKMNDPEIKKQFQETFLKRKASK